MKGLPPLRYLRKTTLVLLVVFLCFIVHCVYVALDDSEGAQADGSVSESKTLSSVVCRNIVGGAPFGVDSVFPVHTRLYYYAELPTFAWDVPDRKVLHVWYHGADTVQKSHCAISKSSCESSLAPQLLVPGEWSVDAVEGRKLLSSRQFRVEPPRK